jgi:hypothetical protein
LGEIRRFRKKNKKKKIFFIKSLLITEKRVASDKISKDFCAGFRLDKCKDEGDIVAWGFQGLLFH